MSYVTSHKFHVTCNKSHITYHMLQVTCHMSHILSQPLLWSQSLEYAVQSPKCISKCSPAKYFCIIASLHWSHQYNKQQQPCMWWYWVDLSKRGGKDVVFWGLVGLLRGISRGQRLKDILRSSSASPRNTLSFPTILLRFIFYYY